MAIKKFNRKIGGLVFWPKEKPDIFFTSVKEWVIAKMPEDAYVHDLADTLVMCNIPISDSTESAGTFFRRPRTSSPELSEIFIDTSCLFERTVAVVSSKVDGILGSNTKDHHKLHY